MKKQSEHILDIQPMDSIASPASLTTDELVTIAIGTFAKIREAYPYLVELRQRFLKAPRGNANIGGCNTWEEFCEKHLNRKPVSVRQMLEGENPASKGGIRSECEHCDEVLESRGQYKKHVRKNHPETLAEAAQNIAVPPKQEEDGFEDLFTPAPTVPLQVRKPSLTVQAACPVNDECEFPEVAAGDIVVLRKGKSFYKLNTVSKATDNSILFGSGGGSARYPKNTYRAWNIILLRIATEEDKQKFDSEWRDINGSLQHESPAEEPETTPKINKHLVGAEVGDEILFNSSFGTCSTTILSIDSEGITFKTGKGDKTIKHEPLTVDCGTIRANYSKDQRDAADAPTAHEPINYCHICNTDLSTPINGELLGPTYYLDEKDRYVCVPCHDCPNQQRLTEEFYVIRRKSDGAFLHQYGTNDVFEPVKLLRPANHYERIEPDIEVRLKEFGARGRGALLTPAEWEWVKVQAKYELTAVEPTESTVEEAA